MNSSPIFNEEIWKPIPEWEGFYEVSNYGRVRRLYKTTFPKVLKPKHRRGYLCVHITTPGREKYLSIHRTVAAVFVPNEKHLSQVNHIDGDKHNNYYRNLEWCTPSDNCRHRDIVLGKHHAHILQSSNRKPIRCIETGEVFMQIKDAGEKFGISHSAIGAVASHKPYYKTAGGYHWEFV